MSIPFRNIYVAKTLFSWMFVIFDRLTLMSALFPPGKTLCSRCLLHTHFQSWACSISPPNFMDFLGHRKSWNRRNFCWVSHLKKRRKKYILFFHKLSGQSKVVKSYFRLAYPHVCTFPVWENIVSMVFFFTPTSLMEKLCTRFSCLGKTIHVCLSYSTPSVMRVFGVASQFYGLFLGHRKSKNRRNLCRVSHLNKNIENKKMCILSQVFWRISSR